MKLKERKEACRLRQEGLSIRKITEKLGVSSSSVSLWVRNIELTDEQKQELMCQCNSGGMNGIKTHKEKCYELRQKYQQIGKDKAKQADNLFVAGCALYWGEGSKTRQASLYIVNADPDMLCLFADFLRNHWDVSDDEMTIYINCYTNNGFTVEEIENYWLQKLNLPRTSLRKTICNNITRTTSGQKKGKLLYGICRIMVNKVNITQGILGAIQELFHIDRPGWLDNSLL